MFSPSKCGPHFMTGIPPGFRLETEDILIKNRLRSSISNGYSSGVPSGPRQATATTCAANCRRDSGTKVTKAASANSFWLAEMKVLLLRRARNSHKKGETKPASPGRNLFESSISKYLKYI